nr:MAG TPA: hypothetical protein [Caudoviricetes sp.]
MSCEGKGEIRSESRLYREGRSGVIVVLHFSPFGIH